jgi:hypothetical protein
MKITMVSGNTLSIALKTRTSESVFMIPGHKKDHCLFSTVKNKIVIKQMQQTGYKQYSCNMIQGS